MHHFFLLNHFHIQIENKNCLVNVSIQIVGPFSDHLDDELDHDDDDGVDVINHHHQNVSHKNLSWIINFWCASFRLINSQRIKSQLKLLAQFHFIYI